MTTAARPTWEPARGGGMKGETDLGKLSKQISTRDLPTQMTLKYRQDGQGNEAEYEDLKVHDYKKDLESRERKAREERNKEKHYKTSGSSAGSIISGAITQGGGGSSRSRRNIDADDVIDDDDDDSSDEEDETADLLNELNKIKAEREEERKIEEVKKQEEEERIRTENILRYFLFFSNLILFLNISVAIHFCKMTRKRIPVLNDDGMMMLFSKIVHDRSGGTSGFSGPL